MDTIPFDIPQNHNNIIKVIGVGGGGGNAVNHMYKQGIEGVDFVICNTDAQALSKSPVPAKIQLGMQLTEGLGAGNRPQQGREAAIESIEEVKTAIGEHTRMVFVTAGMGGGTGTGAAPVIAQASKEAGILTVGIVTLPFRFEGKTRIHQAASGIKEMHQYVDALLIINNQKLREMYGDFPYEKAFGKADDVLTVAAKGIAEIITVEGHVNVDFADVKTVMSNSGIALMGTGTAQGDKRAELAVQEAIESPLLDNNNIIGAKNLLLNIVSGKKKATLDEMTFINEAVQEKAGNNADLIWGSSTDESLGDSISVTVIATGFGPNDIPEIYLTDKDEPIPTKNSKPNPDDKRSPATGADSDKSKYNGGSHTVNSPGSSVYDVPPGGKNSNTDDDGDNDITIINIDSENRPPDNIKFVNDAGKITGQITKKGTDVEPFTAEHQFSPQDAMRNIAQYEEIPAYKRNKVTINIEEGFDSTEEEDNNTQYLYDSDMNPVDDISYYKDKAD